ncbi:MAG: GGDEF domain-containing protein [Halobacteriovoraceae bacterium]|nr:GGDEF domain-containing protein [Halobacteriovoraceae bacterium]|tara:strand:+ start:2442 stop:3347 length:906 start_codon:yes stop_codon:yes gene_type:complete
MSDDATLVITDIKAALNSADEEAAQKPACFLVVGGELNGTIFDLLDGETVVGRSPDCTIPLEFQGISRRHFKVNVFDEEVKVEDLGSSNGTFVNNTKIEGQVSLSKGDMVKLGAIALKYLPKGDTERLTYDKLHEEANTDGLTKCYNKTYFNNRLDLEVKKSKVTGNPLSLVIFDLDHFKHLNDNYGHDAGDFVLKEKAQLLRDHGIRKGDIFARYGGEEFVVLLPKTNLKQAFEIAERLRKLVETHDFIYDGKKLPVTASIGVADYRQGVNTGTDLFKRADSAVYKSKQGGRNQVNFFRA